jgi:hypothetical protein
LRSLEALGLPKSADRERNWSDLFIYHRHKIVSTKKRPRLRKRFLPLARPLVICGTDPAQLSATRRKALLFADTVLLVSHSYCFWLPELRWDLDFLLLRWGSKSSLPQLEFQHIVSEVRLFA